MPKPFIGGNWKNNGTKASTTELINVLNGGVVDFEVDVAICPPFIHIPYVQQQLKNPKMFVAAQNCSIKTGAFTGEVACQLLKDFGVNWTILGHSERRQYYGETNEVVAAKTAAAYEAGLSVIGCLGETRAEREDTTGSFFDKVIYPSLAAYAAVTKDWTKLVIAYEPVWAIGTGLVATPEQAQEVHAKIRQWLASNVNPQVAADTRIIYGGSVTGGNAAELYTQKDVDGFLVGGASLKPDFLTIIAATKQAK